MMLRLTVDIPTDTAAEGVAFLIKAGLAKEGLTLRDGWGTSIDVDLVNVDVVPEGRLI